MPKIKWQGETDDAMGWESETMQGCMDLKQLCSSVRATLMNIPKQASCRLYKKFQGCVN